MAASQYQRDRKRIYSEAESRGPGWKRRALHRLDLEYDARPIKQGHRVLGVRLGDDRVICKKKSFNTEEIAQDSLDQIHRCAGTHTKPQRAYQCFHCSLWHLTHWSKLPSTVDDSRESC